MIRKFMEARIAREGAETFLAAEARKDFRPKATMGPLYLEPPLRDFRIVFVDGPLGGPSYEVGVRLIFDKGSFGDTLFVAFDGRRYFVTGGRSGLIGP